MPGSNAHIIAVLRHNRYLWSRFDTIHIRIDLTALIIVIFAIIVGHIVKKRKILSEFDSVFFGITICFFTSFIIIFMTMGQGATTAMTVGDKTPQVIGDSPKETLCGQHVDGSGLTLSGYTKNNIPIVIKNVPKIRQQIKELHHTKKLLNTIKNKKTQVTYHNNLSQWIIYKNAEERLSKKYNHLHHEVKANLLSLHEFMVGKPAHIII